LFDEPLSNLDAKLRTVMRKEVKLLHQRLKTTSIYVTHDQTEAMTMADRIVVMQAGRIEQVGTPLELYNGPDNLFVAGFIGAPQMNLLQGRAIAKQDRFVMMHGEAELALPAGLPLTNGQEIVLGIRPELLRVDPIGDLQATVEVIEPMGSETHLTCEIDGTEIRLVEAADIDIQPNAVIRLSFDAAKVHVFDKQSEARLIRSEE
jgi:multiple sugar transport system ATP-binding protein